MGEVNGGVAISPSMSPVMYAWQGLRYDPFTGDYDNLARRYKQNTGTFDSQDPSGIAGGLNLYGSRKNNPLLYVDRDGKNPYLIGAAVCVVTYGAISVIVERTASSTCVSTLPDDQRSKTNADGTKQPTTEQEQVCVTNARKNNLFQNIGSVLENYSK